MVRGELELGICRFQVQRPNQSATLAPLNELEWARKEFSQWRPLPPPNELERSFRNDDLCNNIFKARKQISVMWIAFVIQGLGFQDFALLQPSPKKKEPSWKVVNCRMVSRSPPRPVPKRKSRSWVLFLMFSVLCRIPSTLLRLTRDL